MDTKKLLKIAGISTLLLASGTASAGWKYNFLLGGSAGYGWRNGDVNVTDYIFNAAGPRTIIDTAYHSHHLSDGGFVGGVFGGIQAKCNRLLLGLEISADWDDVDDVDHFVGASTYPVIPLNSPYNSTLRYDRGTVVGLSMRAGYQMMSWLMPYIRVGAETSDDTLTYTANFANINAIRFSAEESTRVWRFLAGAGVEFPLFWHLNGRIEYNYSSKGKAAKLMALSNDTPPAAASPTREHYLNTKQHQHTAKASIVWNFPAI